MDTETMNELLSRFSGSESDYTKEDLQLLNYLQTLGKGDIKKELASPTQLRISTQSAKCRLTYKINMEKAIPIIRDIVVNETCPTIVGLEYRDIGVGEIKRKKKVATIDKKKFYNQVTIIARASKDSKNITIKFFLNGSISMTGCKEGKDGYDAVVNIITELKKYPKAFDKDQDAASLLVLDYSITMINADYEVGFKINRDCLYSQMIKNHKVYCSYDPTIYQGVKISYMWNKDSPICDGICKCATGCRLEKTLRKKNTCKIVTIAIFQSGKIIITGASDFVQTKEAYKFINKILYDNYDEIKRISILDYNE